MGVLIYVKSVIAGLVVLVTSVVAIAAITVATFYYTELSHTGSAGIGAVSVGIPSWWLIAPAVAFAVGFGWEFRRASRRARG